MARDLVVQDLGRMGWADANRLQQELVAQRKAGVIPDQLLLVEHPHVVTLGRNARVDNILASPEMLARAGIEVYETNRGGDVTYHGPGQIVGYPIMDLKEWKLDVRAYVAAMTQAISNTLAGYGIQAYCDPQSIGVWVDDAKIAAIGVHLSRWITSHGFALNHQTDLSYFRHIVPCGLSKPVTSMEALGVTGVSRADITASLVRHFGKVFDRTLSWAPQFQEMVFRNTTEKI
jgi:lipoyl(octanoyl) transferase